MSARSKGSLRRCIRRRFGSEVGLFAGRTGINPEEDDVSVCGGQISVSLFDFFSKRNQIRGGLFVIQDPGMASGTPRFEEIVHPLIPRQHLRVIRR